MALLLINRGIKQVRPLEGGLHAWLELSYPFVSVDLALLGAAALVPGTDSP